MLIAFSVAPSGVGELSGAGPSDSVSAAVTEAVRIVRESGLPNRTDSMFTTIEGDWDECMDVVKRACEAVGRYGSRVSLVLKADIRPGHTGELTGKVARVEAGLAASRTRRPAGTGDAIRRPAVTARIRIGVSGWTYPHWRSVFYPKGSAAAPGTGVRIPGVRHAGAQRVVLLAAAAEQLREVAGRHARRFRLRGQGQPVHHPPEEAGRRRPGAGQLSRVRGAVAGPEAGPDAVAAAAEAAVPARIG